MNMADQFSTSLGTTSPEQEIAELREEIRHLHEEQERQKKQISDNANSGGRGEDGKDGSSKNREGDKPDDKQSQEQEKKPHPVRNAVLIVAGLVIVVAGVLWWLHARHFESTDDAQVDGHISGLAARVAGAVTNVYVDENQFVKAGQVVADLDPRDYKAAVEQARQQLAQAQAQAEAEEPNIPVTEVTNQTNIAATRSDVVAAEAGVAAAQRSYESALAVVRQAEANSAKAQADVERYRPLAEKDEVPREQFDQVVATAKALAATVSANQSSAEASLREVDQRRAQLAQAVERNEEARRNAPNQIAIRRANVATRRSAAGVARAQLEQALLNLSYCKIITLVSGVVARRIAEVGQHVAPGQQVLMVTQLDDLWVTANFREVQIRQMHAGQGARLHIDALNLDFDGYLDSMPAATGAVTSLLPPENATGNFVKVVQRLPVRIRFKKEQTGLDRLRPGMSVEPKVRID